MGRQNLFARLAMLEAQVYHHRGRHAAVCLMDESHLELLDFSTLSRQSEAPVVFFERRQGNFVVAPLVVGQSLPCLLPRPLSVREITQALCRMWVVEAISQIGNFCLVLYSVMYSRYGWT